MIRYDLEPIPNFSLEEMRCKCGCGLVIMQTTLLNAIDVVRGELEAPITVASWTRCKEHNKAEGGKRNSYHLYGRAVDIHPSDGITDEFERLCRIWFPYVKRYISFCHCDIRGRRRL